MTGLDVAPEEVYGRTLVAEPAHLARAAIALVGTAPAATTAMPKLTGGGPLTMQLSGGDVLLLTAAGRPRGLLRVVERQGRSRTVRVMYAIPGLVVQHDLLDSGQERLTGVSTPELLPQLQGRWRELAAEAPASGDEWRWGLRVDVISARTSGETSPWLALLGAQDGTLWTTEATHRAAADPEQAVSDEADERLRLLLLDCGAYDAPHDADAGGRS